MAECNPYDSNFFAQNFTDEAHSLILAGIREAEGLGYTAVDAEHFLLGMLSTGSSRTALDLKALSGRSIETAREDVKRALNFSIETQRKAKSDCAITFTARAQAVLSVSIEAAASFGEPKASVDHLFFCGYMLLVHREDSIANEILEEWGLNFKQFVDSPQQKSIEAIAEERCLLVQKLMEAASATGCKSKEFVDQLLCEYSSLLDGHFIEIFRARVQEILSDAKSQENHKLFRNIAVILSFISNVIRTSHHGKQETNIEICIAGTQGVLLNIDQTILPAPWMASQINLGLAYAERIRGKRNENSERALQYLETGIEASEKDGAFPQLCSQGKLVLAQLYLSKGLGNKENNIDEAIRLYQSLLLVYSYDSSPSEWLGVRNGLTIAYGKRGKIEDIEKSISICQDALETIPNSIYRDKRAYLISNLASAYASRQLGDVAQNLEKQLNTFERH